MREFFVCLFVNCGEEREKILMRRHFLIYIYFLLYVSEMTVSSVVFITQTKASSSGASSASRIPKLCSLLSRSRTTTSVIIKRRQKRNESLYSTTTSLTTTTATSASYSSSLPRLLSLQKHTLVDDGEGGSFVFSSRRLLFNNAGKASSSSSTKSSSSSSTSKKKKRSQNKRSHHKKTIKCESETRIASVLTSLPQRLDLYFQRRSYRMLLWKTIFIFVGFYLASVITLSFGALGINDVVAGALCVFVYETITRWYYKTSRPGRKLEFVNCFKLGLVYSLIADAFKLGS